jgi:hypothetical protein
MLPQYIIFTYKTYNDCLRDKPSSVTAVTAYSLSRAISIAQAEHNFKEEEQEVVIIRKQGAIKSTRHKL